MSDTVLAYLVSLGIIVAGVVWIVVGASAVCIAVGVATLAVGLVSFLGELGRRA